MNDTASPPVDVLRASSDLDGKLVTRPDRAVTPNVSRVRPEVDSRSSRIGEDTPKLGSTLSLLNTSGYPPSATAVTQPLVHPAGSTVRPGTTVSAGAV